MPVNQKHIDEFFKVPSFLTFCLNYEHYVIDNPDGSYEFKNGPDNEIFRKCFRCGNHMRTHKLSIIDTCSKCDSPNDWSLISGGGY